MKTYCILTLALIVIPMYLIYGITQSEGVLLLAVAWSAGVLAAILVDYIGRQLSRSKDDNTPNQ